jgi:hypothetical protein
MSNELKTPGNYDCSVISDTSNGLFQSTKGTLGVRVNMQVIAGPQAGQTIAWTGWLSDKSWEGTAKALHETFGFGGVFEEIAELPDLFLDQTCSIVAEMEPSEDGTKEYLRVRWLNPYGKSASAPVLAPNAGKDLLKRMNLTNRASALLKSSGPASGTTATVESVKPPY